MGMAMAVLLLAIGIEVGATAALPRADSFHARWTAVVLVGYAVSIWMLAIVVRQVPVSVAYAIWAGLGTAAIAVVGVVRSVESLGPDQGARPDPDHRRRRRARTCTAPTDAGAGFPRNRPGIGPGLSAGFSAGSAARLDQGGVQAHGEHRHLVHRLGGAALGAVLAAAPDRGDDLLDEPDLAVGGGLNARRCRGSRPYAASSPATLAIIRRRRRSAWSPCGCGPGRSSPAGRAAPR